MTLTQLDEAFQSIWRQPNQINSLLDAWQHLVQEYLQDPPEEPILLAHYLKKWATILEENKRLIQAQQEVLKGKLKTGEPKVSHAKLKKTFQL